MPAQRTRGCCGSQSRQVLGWISVLERMGTQIGESEHKLRKPHSLQTPVHLPYSYEVSFADRVGFHADVHEVFFALKRLENEN